MTTIVKFYQHSGYINYWYADKDAKDGEYVPLAEYQALKTHMESLAKESYQLKGLIRRVIEIGPEIYDNWDDIEGWKSDRLTQLLKDCQEAL